MHGGMRWQLPPRRPLGRSGRPPTFLTPILPSSTRPPPEFAARNRPGSSKDGGESLGGDVEDPRSGGVGAATSARVQA
jgi:hypothetical protein